MAKERKASGVIAHKWWNWHKQEMVNNKILVFVRKYIRIWWGTTKEHRTRILCREQKQGYITFLGVYKTL